MSNIVYLYNTFYKKFPKESEFQDFFANSGNEYESKYTMPFFWLLMFEEDNLFTYDFYCEETSRVRKIPYLISKKSECINRLNQWSGIIQKILNPNMCILYNEWIKKIASENFDNVIVNLTDIDFMSDEGILQNQLKESFNQFTINRISHNFIVNKSMAMILPLNFEKNIIDIKDVYSFVGYCYQNPWMNNYVDEKKIVSKKSEVPKIIRTSFGNKKYWDKQQELYFETTFNMAQSLKNNSKNLSFDSEYSWHLIKYYFKLILTLYSSGKPITELTPNFNGLLDAWELSNKLADELKATLEPNQGFDLRHIAIIAVSDDSRAYNDPRSWVFNLSNFNHYHWCFQVVSLALLLDIEEDLWKRLLTLIGGDGEDKLLDMVIASRQKNRKIGDKLLHKKPYGRLLKAIESSKETQSQLLLEFVDNWYVELEKKKGSEEVWWIMKGVPMEKILEMGNYFGYWCVESTACVKVFSLDDSLCLKHSHYPKAFLYEDEPIKKSIWQNIKEKIFK